MYLQESNKIPVKHIMVLYLVSMETSFPYCVQVTKETYLYRNYLLHLENIPTITMRNSTKFSVIQNLSY